MNNELPSRNIIYTHRVLNYMNASFQGKFAALNILSQFNHSGYSQEDIQTTKDTLLVVRTWMENLITGRFLLFEDHKQNEEGLKALELLKALIPELTELSMEVKKILVSEECLADPQNCIFLVSALGRSTYAKDNYVRGFVKFGKQSGDQELVEQYSVAMKNISAGTQLVTDLVNGIKTTHTLDNEFIRYIDFSCRMLPGIFRAHCHDIKQLLCGPKKTFTFRDAGFSEMELESWKNAEFDSFSAGYWKAHEIHSAEALVWMGAGIIDPEVASEWKTAEFAPNIASLWLEIGFSPFLAIMWDRRGFSPPVAHEIYQQGYHTPEEIPDEILKKYFPELFEGELSEEAKQSAEQKAIMAENMIGSDAPQEVGTESDTVIVEEDVDPAEAQEIDDALSGSGTDDFAEEED